MFLDQGILAGFFLRKQIPRTATVIPIGYYRGGNLASGVQPALANG